MNFASNPALLPGAFTARAVTPRLLSLLSALALVLVFAGGARAQEAGFIVSHPPSCGDGESVPIAFTASPEGGKVADRVKVIWREKEFFVPLSPDSSGNLTGLCMVSVPLDSALPSFDLSVRLYAGSRPLEEARLSKIMVAARAYEVQALTVPPKFVNPPPEMEERIKRERKEMGAALSAILPERYWRETPFVLPVPGGMSSPYGVRRVYNNEPRSPHRGLDLRGAEGVPIAACAPGKVTLAADHYYAGQVVVVDHGLGVKTFYMHMSRIDCKVGDMVQAGQILGLVGATGRVTGPHLHLGYHVLGETINPECVLPPVDKSGYVPSPPAAQTASAKKKGQGSKSAAVKSSAGGSGAKTSAPKSTKGQKKNG